MRRTKATSVAITDETMELLTERDYGRGRSATIEAILQRYFRIVGTETPDGAMSESIGEQLSNRSTPFEAVYQSGLVQKFAGSELEFARVLDAAEVIATKRKEEG